VFLCRASGAAAPLQEGALPQPPTASHLASLCLALSLALAALPAAAQDTGDWPMPGRDFAGWRYSGLDQIDIAKVARWRR
jgi:glucose dehydrogenase